jgi:NB-ARC domain/Domain of unknown function (DUF4062)
MTTPRHFRVFLSSPGDVSEEREHARKIIKDELPYDPFIRGQATLDIVSWDDPASRTPMLANLTPQEAVDRGLPKPSECDFVVVILWGRFGTPLPETVRKPNGERYLSGTEWEYEDAKSAKPQPDILIYRRTEKVLFDADDDDYLSKREQRKRVNEFFERFRSPDDSYNGGVSTYDTPHSFAERLKGDLRALLERKLTPALPRGTLRLNTSMPDATLGSPETPVPVPSEQAPADYVDRPELTQPLLAYLLADHAEKGRATASAIHGIGGIGKTTVARWLIWLPEIEQRFNHGRIWVTLGQEPKDALAVVSNCISKLNPTLKTKTNLEDARDDLATMLRDRSVLLVIDDVWPKSAEVAEALLVPSERSHFLLTTRYPRLAKDLRVKDFPLDEMNANQAKALITRTLGRALTLPEQSDTESLTEIVGGHPFALELAVTRIKNGSRTWASLLKDLTGEVARLEALDEPDDELIAPVVADKARRKTKSIRASLLLSVRYLQRYGQERLAQLGVVGEDAMITKRMAATLWSVQEEKALQYLNELSGAGLLRVTGHAFLMHDLVRDVARGLLTDPKDPAREGDIPGLGLTLQEASRQLLEHYRAKMSDGLWHTLPDDGYIHDHLLSHFEQADCLSELESLLWEKSADGHCGWYQTRERLGQTAGFLADVDRVWRYADRVGAAAAIDVQRAQAIALQLHCALIIASINSLSAGIPDVLLVPRLSGCYIHPQYLVLD